MLLLARVHGAKSNSLARTGCRWEGALAVPLSSLCLARVGAEGALRQVGLYWAALPNRFSVRTQCRGAFLNTTWTVSRCVYMSKI